MHLHWLLASVKGIPVLMYHRVMHGVSDGLTITPRALKEQWQYLKSNGYNSLSLSDFLHCTKTGKYPEKSVLITFDDGYVNNLLYVYPLLIELNWQATFFIIADNVDGTAKKNLLPLTAMMDVSQLRALDPNVVQLAMHGYNHENFSELSFDEIKNVVQKSILAFENSGLQYHKTIAYPYGSRPHDKQQFKDLKKWMREIGITAAFRIGNQVCRIPATDIYELKRIDIKGTDTLKEFKIKLRKGKLKPF
ncbi:MAG: polysaccharide deacetylase family protein [Taibaiella sp.]|nr:polysaccharide deacetylase family protein [Taibaiella sp.]